jgi:hypothetical protein
MDDGASAALAAAVTVVLREVPGLSAVFDGAPIGAGDAHAEVEMGPETDWGHKSGAGAELRFALLVRCGGERPDRARALSGGVRRAVEKLGPVVSGWRLVSLAMLRSRVTPARKEERPGWTAMVEYRARLLREP